MSRYGRQMLLVPWTSNPKSSVHPHKVPAFPYQKVGTDGARYLLTIDYYSKYSTWCIPLEYTSTSDVINALDAQFVNYGIPETLFGHWTSICQQVLHSVCKNDGFTYVTSSPGHPASNGLAYICVYVYKYIYIFCKYAR